jgi:hypothetical protein
MAMKKVMVVTLAMLALSGSALANAVSKKDTRAVSDPPSSSTVPAVSSTETTVRLFIIIFKKLPVA